MVSTVQNTLSEELFKSTLASAPHKYSQETYSIEEIGQLFEDCQQILTAIFTSIPPPPLKWRIAFLTLGDSRSGKASHATKFSEENGGKNVFSLEINQIFQRMNSYSTSIKNGISPKSAYEYWWSGAYAIKLLVLERLIENGIPFTTTCKKSCAYVTALLKKLEKKEYPIVISLFIRKNQAPEKSVWKKLPMSDAPIERSFDEKNSGEVDVWVPLLEKLLSCPQLFKCDFFYCPSEGNPEPGCMWHSQPLIAHGHQPAMAVLNPAHYQAIQGIYNAKVDSSGSWATLMQKYVKHTVSFEKNKIQYKFC
jgi:hypothetical protein